MSGESVDDRERGEPDFEARGAGLAAEIDRLWADLRDEDDLLDGNDGVTDGDELDDRPPTAVIDAVVEPPAGASQSAVEEAVAAAEDDEGPTQQRDTDDHLSI
jgi:hypothetical protein